MIAETPAAGTPPPDLAATIVICTINDDDRLDAAIHSAMTQVTDHDFELIVVNNRPTDPALAARIARLHDKYPELHALDCHELGLSAARNTALSHAAGSIFCCVDDDAVAMPGWLDLLIETYAANDSIGVLGGPIRLVTPDPTPWAVKPRWEALWSAYATHCTTLCITSDWGEYPYGANWSARTDLLRSIGGFPLTYGRVGRDSALAEETVAGLKINQLGYAVAIHPDAVVEHHVEPDRFTLGYVRHAIRAGIRARERMIREGHIDEVGGRLDAAGQAMKFLVKTPLTVFSPDLMLDSWFRALAYLEIVLRG